VLVPLLPDLQLAVMLLIIFCMVSIVYTELVQFTDSAFSEAVDKLHRAIVDCMLSYKENVDQDILKKVKRKKKYSIVVVYILYCACQVPD
jgi:hypothetical protein